MRKLATDLMILQAIYDEYYAEYVRFETGKNTRPSKTFVPIDHKKIASRTKMDCQIILERFAFMEQKYGYKNESVHYSLFPMGSDEVNFAFLAAVLADQQHEQRTQRYNLIAAAVSAIGAILSAIFAALAIKG